MFSEYSHRCTCKITECRVQSTNRLRLQAHSDCFWYGRPATCSRYRYMAAIIAALACTQIANRSGLIFIRHLVHREDVLGRRCLTHPPLRTSLCCTTLACPISSPSQPSSGCGSLSTHRQSFKNMTAVSCIHHSTIPAVANLVACKQCLGSHSLPRCHPWTSNIMPCLRMLLPTSPVCAPATAQKLWFAP